MNSAISTGAQVAHYYANVMKSPDKPAADNTYWTLLVGQYDKHNNSRNMCSVFILRSVTHFRSKDCLKVLYFKVMILKLSLTCALPLLCQLVWSVFPHTVIMTHLAMGTVMRVGSAYQLTVCWGGQPILVFYHHQLCITTSDKTMCSLLHSCYITWMNSINYETLSVTK